MENKKLNQCVSVFKDLKQKLKIWQFKNKHKSHNTLLHYPQLGKLQVKLQAILPVTGNSNQERAKQAVSNHAHFVIVQKHKKVVKFSRRNSHTAAAAQHKADPLTECHSADNRHYVPKVDLLSVVDCGHIFQSPLIF